MASQSNDMNSAGSASISQWLESLMLQQYQSHFVAAGFDVLSKCTHLTDSDLVRIGIGPGGYRKRILAHLPIVKEGGLLPPNINSMESSIYGTAQNIEADDDDDEDDREIYDIPPPAMKKSSQVHKPEAAYVNLHELNDIPVPVLPPKKRGSTIEEIDRSLGIFSPPVLTSGASDSKPPQPYGLLNSALSPSLPPAVDSKHGALVSASKVLLEKSDVTDSAADMDLTRRASVDKPIPKPRILRKPVESSLTQGQANSRVDLSPAEIECLSEPTSLSSNDLSSMPKTETVTKKLNAGLELELEMFVTSVKKSLLKSEGSNGNGLSGLSQPQQPFDFTEKSTPNSSALIASRETGSPVLKQQQSDSNSEDSSLTQKYAGEIEYELCGIWSSAVNLPSINDVADSTYCEISVSSSDQEGNKYDQLTSAVTTSSNVVETKMLVDVVEGIVYDNVDSSDFLCPTLPAPPPPVPRRRETLPVVNSRSSVAEFAKFAEERLGVSNKLKPKNGSDIMLSPSAAGFSEAFDSYFNQPDVSCDALSPEFFKAVDVNSAAPLGLEYTLPVDTPVISQALDTQYKKEDAEESLYETALSFTRGSSSTNFKPTSSSKLHIDLPAAEYVFYTETEKANGKMPGYDFSQHPINADVAKQPTNAKQSKMYFPSSHVEVPEEIRYSGYLSKANIGLRTEMIRRWCVLEKGTLSCFDSDKSPVARETFDDQDMLSISVCNDSRFTNAFELRCLRSLGSSSSLRSSVFVAEAVGDSIVWISVIAMSMASRMYCSALQQVVDLQYGGIVYARWVASSASSDWHRTWMHLNNKVLYIYSQECGIWLCGGKGANIINKQKNEFETYDLRKAKDIRLVQQLADFGASAAGPGSSIVIDLPAGRTVWLQNEVQQEIENIFSILRASMREAASSLSSQPLTVDNVPIIVEKLTNFVGLHGMEVEGVYRLSGQNSKVAQLLKCCQDVQTTGLFALFDVEHNVRGMIIKLEDYQIHDVTNALKRFLRTLNEPLLTEKLYPRWIAAAKLNDVSKLQAYKEILNDLPEVNHATLKFLVMHLMRVVKKEPCNKMSIVNVASIFGPCMFKLENESQPATDFGSTNFEISIFKDFLDHHQLLFQVDNKDLERENKIEDAVRRIEQLNTDRSSLPMIPQGDMLLGIHINNKEGNVIFHKVPTYMTASELVLRVLEKMDEKEKSRRRWIIFEISSNSDLERPLHSSEGVINATLKWGTWPMDICRDNFLCLKHSSIYDGLECFNPNDNLYAELHYAPLGKKTFRRLYFEFNEGTISYRRDARAGIAISWNVLDLIVYLGVQQQRSPPTKFGFSFYAKGEVLSGNFLGHSICCENEQEFYQWLAAIFRTQYPGGLDGKPAQVQSDGKPAQVQSQSIGHVSLHNIRPSDDASSSPSTDTTNRMKQLTSILQKKFIKR